MFVKIDGRLVYLWRAVDAEGEVLDVLVQSKWDKRAALKLMRKLLKKMGFVPDKIVTDDLRFYGAAARDLGISHRHQRGRWRHGGGFGGGQAPFDRVRNRYEMERCRGSAAVSMIAAYGATIRDRRHREHEGAGRPIRTLSSELVFVAGVCLMGARPKQRCEARPQESQSERAAALSLVGLDLPNQHAIARMVLRENASRRKVL